MIQQLNPPLPLMTPKGKALAHIIIDYGPEHHLVWVCFQDNGEIWSWKNPDVRAEDNITFSRTALTYKKGMFSEKRHEN